MSVKKTILFILLLTQVNAYANMSPERVRKYVASSGGVENVLKNMADEAANNLPQKIDTETETFAVTVFSNQINFNNRLINLNKSDISDSLMVSAKKTMVQSNTNFVCSSPVSKVLINEFGAIYSYSLYSKSNEYLFQYKISKNECKHT